MHYNYVDQSLKKIMSYKVSLALVHPLFNIFIIYGISPLKFSRRKNILFTHNSYQLPKEASKVTTLVLQRELSFSLSLHKPMLLKKFSIEFKKENLRLGFKLNSSVSLKVNTISNNTKLLGLHIPLLLSTSIRQSLTNFNRFCIRSFQTQIYPKLKVIALTSFFNPYKISKRHMKRLANTVILGDSNKERLTLQVEKTISNLYTTPINDKTNLLDKISHQFAEPGEHIVNQTLIKGSHSRISYKKSEMLDSLKTHTTISSKLHIENASEKSDFRFLPELLISSRYSETSDLIKEVKLNSEKETASNLISKIQTGNLRADTNISYSLDNKPFTVYRDIKIGNNLNNITKGILGEIPYIKDGGLFSIINEPLSLREINKQRIQIIDNSNLMKNSMSKDQLTVHVATIQSLEPLLLQSEMLYNNAVQNQLYAIMALEKTINFSVYYGIIVAEARCNQDFYNKLYPHLTTEIFNNKKAFNIFMAKAVIIYHNTVNPVLNNIQKTKGTDWEASFIDNIKDDIFN